MSAVAAPQPDARQRALLDAAADLADGQLAGRAQDDDATATFPRAAFDRMGELGLAGLTVPTELGGAGQPAALSVQVLERLAQAHVVAALTLSVHSLATTLLLAGGRGRVRDEVVPALAAGRALGAYCLSEPHSGSDAAALATTATRDGGHYVLRGTKAWVTHGGHADYYVVMARTPDAHGELVPGARGITAFCVPAGAAGLEAGPPERKMGMAASPTAPIHLDGVRVPVDHRVGEEGQGFSLALDGLDGGRLGVAAIAVGLAQAALDASVAFARRRRQFGQPVGEFQGVGFLLADMAAAVESARALVRQAAAGRDATERVTRLAATAKLVATDAAMRVATDAVQVHGAHGCTPAAGVERLFREAKVMQIFEGTNQIQRQVIARELVGRA